MIVLYRPRESARGDELQKRLETLVVAHRVVFVDENHPNELPDDAVLPTIGETDALHSDEESIARFFDELEAELSSARIYSADACYVNPKKPDECV